jgi:hypothetical protein
LIAIEYHCRPCSTKTKATRHAYKQPDADDIAHVTKAERLVQKQPSPYWPDELIPNGAETARLLRWGYNRWTDLFSARQLYGLGLLATKMAEQQDGPVKRALFTILSDLLRYQNLLCRYDRQALKPTDVFAVHGFPVPRVVCEAGPFSANAVSVAAAFVTASRSTYGRSGGVASRMRRPKRGGRAPPLRRSRASSYPRPSSSARAGVPTSAGGRSRPRSSPVGKAT